MLTFPRIAMIPSKMFKFLPLMLLLLLWSPDFSEARQLTSALNKLENKAPKLTEEEIVNGLKEALHNGISKGTGQASSKDGFFNNPNIKIPFPHDAQKVEKRLREIGMGDKVDNFVHTLNNAAEQASKDALPIFEKAIKSMSLKDARNILAGKQDAATQYLKKTTTPQLTTEFKPIIQKALESTNATKYYKELMGAYDKIPFVRKVNPDLTNYTTGKAIDGLFKLVAKEEANIRANPGARTSELLKKVFK